jgi:hypothetical protein
MSAASPTIPEGPFGRDQYAPLFQVVRHFVSFLKWRFSLLPQGSYRFDAETENTPEQKNSEIFIGADTPIRSDVVGKRPAITVLRTQAAFSGLGIGDLAFRDLATGGHSRMDLVPTNIMINCLSQEPVEAEMLADFCRQQVSAFREEIVKASNGLLLYTGSKPMLSAPSPAGSLVDTVEDDWRVVVVSFPTYIQDVIHVLPLNKKILNGVNISASVGRQPGTPLSEAQLEASVQPPSTLVSDTGEVIVEDGTQVQITIDVE